MKITVNTFELCTTLIVIMFGIISILVLTQHIGLDKIQIDGLVVMYAISVGLLRFKKIFGESK